METEALTKCEHFYNGHCCTSDCPNIQCDMADDKWGFGIAEDMGLERIRCSDCVYYDKRCDCDDCYFRYSEECPKMEEIRNGQSENLTAVQ